MDIQHFIKIFWRKKFLLLSIALATVFLAFVVVSLQPPVYKSNAILSAGITIDKTIKINQNDPFVQEFEINTKFSNLIENMKSRTSIRQLSYRLLLHDLMGLQNDTTIFREYPSDNEDLADVTPEELKRFTNTLYHGQAGLLDTAAVLSMEKSIIKTTLTQQDDALFHKLAKAYEYDFESLGKKLTIARIGKTDFLKVEFESEDPRLCEYAVETFCREFIAYTTESTDSEGTRSVRFFEKLALQKKLTLDTLTNAIGEYKKSHNIVDLEAQSESVVSLLADLTKLKAEESKTIEGRKRAIGNLNTYIDKSITDGTDNYSSEASLNNRFVAIDNEIKSISEKLVSSGNDAKLRRDLENKKAERNKVLEQLSSKQVTKGKKFDEKADKLEDNRISEEVDLAMAEEAVKSIDTEISKLRGQATNLVSAEKDIENLQGRKEIALQEYLNAVEQLNSARLRLSSMEQVNPITVFEHAQVPEKPEPSNRTLIAGFAGIAGLSLSTFFLFLIALFDGRVQSPEYFERITNSKLLGYLNHIKIDQLDLEGLFERSTSDAKLNHFKEALRRIRFNLVNSRAKTILITSSKAQTGKTFALLSLAYSLSKNKKRVLIIDTNFKNNTLTGFANKEVANNPLYNGYLSSESYMDNFNRQNAASSDEEQMDADMESRPGALSLLTTKRKKASTSLILNGTVDIIGNIQSSHSPSEILAGKDFNAIIENFEQEYDYIFMEAAALNDFSDTRELVQYADKVIAVFDAKSPIRLADKESIAFLNGMGEEKYLGAILNQVDLKNLN